MMQIQEFKEAKLGIIPEDWELYPLDDKNVVIKFRSGGTLLTSEKEYGKMAKFLL